MWGEISDVKDLMLSFLNTSDNTLSYMSDYKSVVLMTFNDPCIGPMTVLTIDGKTSSNKILREEIKRISYGGGGDGPELMFSGLEKALHHVDSESVFYVVTDDWIKDFELASKIERLAVEKKMTLNFLSYRLYQSNIFSLYPQI